MFHISGCKPCYFLEENMKVMKKDTKPKITKKTGAENYSIRNETSPWGGLQAHDAQTPRAEPLARGEALQDWARSAPCSQALARRRQEKHCLKK